MSRFHSIQRFLTLTGLLVAAAAAIVVAGELPAWDRATIESAANGQKGTLVMGAMYAFAAGLGVAIVTFLLDVIVGVFSAAGRRSALGFNVILQVALAVVLLVGLNAWSFLHYQRWDLTRDRLFTIDADVAARLRELRGETTVIVHQQHKSAGRPGDAPADRYDAAAERKVVEKVKDLVDQLREFGPQFRVVVLDVEDEEFDRKLAAEAQRFPGLDAAMKSAPESSIFFCAGHNVQRMSFSEFYLLDKAASREANGGRGNLVLLDQGIEPFARRVLAIEEKRPRVGVAVIHDILTTRSSADALTLAGLGKSLAANGFEVRDIVLKKWGEEGPSPASYTADESRLEQLEEDLADINATIPIRRTERENVQKMVKRLREKSLEEINYELRDQLRGATFTETDRQNNLVRFEALLNFINSELTELEEDRRKSEDELTRLLQNESVVEGRHVSDLKAKTERLLADCDVLLIPRMTILDLLNGQRIPQRVYKLDPAQVAAIRGFVRSGKPVFLMFGPANEPNTPQFPPDLGEADALEALFRELGLVFGDQTIVYNAEARALNERRFNLLGGARGADVPPLDFESIYAPGLVRSTARPHPLRQSLRQIAHSTGLKLDLVLRAPRPVYFVSNRGQLGHQPEFLLTDAATWNESRPFPERGYAPRFDPPKADDPKKGTRDEERRGPFPVGVAAQTTVPPEWLDEKYGALKAGALVGALSPGTGFGPLLTEAALPVDDYARADRRYRPIGVRLAAIGHGGVFASPNALRPDLDPAREQLLLQTINWLLGREDRLPRADKVWQYPRADLGEREQTWWRWGTFLGLPALFAYAGLVVLMIRKMR